MFVMKQGFTMENLYHVSGKSTLRIIWGSKVNKAKLSLLLFCYLATGQNSRVLHPLVREAWEDGNPKKNLLYENR